MLRFVHSIIMSLMVEFDFKIHIHSVMALAR